MLVGCGEFSLARYSQHLQSCGSVLFMLLCAAGSAMDTAKDWLVGQPRQLEIYVPAAAGVAMHWSVSGAASGVHRAALN